MTVEHLAPVIDLSTRSRLPAAGATPSRASMVPAPEPSASSAPEGLLRLAEMALHAQRILDNGVAPDQVTWWTGQRDTYLNAMLLVAHPQITPMASRRAMSRLSEALDETRVRAASDLVVAAHRLVC